MLEKGADDLLLCTFESCSTWKFIKPQSVDEAPNMVRVPNGQVKVRQCWIAGFLPVEVSSSSLYECRDTKIRRGVASASFRHQLSMQQRVSLKISILLQLECLGQMTQNQPEWYTIMMHCLQRPYLCLKQSKVIQVLLITSFCMTSYQHVLGLLGRQLQCSRTSAEIFVCKSFTCLKPCYLNTILSAREI
jgi:hypothetical protein